MAYLISYTPEGVVEASIPISKSSPTGIKAAAAVVRSFGLRVAISETEATPGDNIRGIRYTTVREYINPSAS